MSALPRKMLLLALSASVISGCSVEGREARALAKTVADQQEKISSLEKQLGELKNEQAVQKLFADADRIAYLTPGSDGYSVIRTDLGPMTVKLQDVRPYANGSKVVLQIGNLSGAVVDGAKFTTEWGSVDAQGSPANETAKSREVAVAKPLSAGAWNNLEVVLDGLPPAQLGFVRIRDFSHRGIRLSTR